MLKKSLKINHFALLLSLLNFLFFHLPFYTFVIENVDYTSVSGIAIVISLIVSMILLTAFLFYLLIMLSSFIGKSLLVSFFIINAIALYFITTYGVIIDESMIGNILNTSYEESSSFFSITLCMYILLLGILPGYYISKVDITKTTLGKFASTSVVTIVLILALVFANASNWLWIDKNSKTLGGLAMPWSYTVNASLFYMHQIKKNEKEIPLPDAILKDGRKSVVVLIIGESARSENFSLYGYQKSTNPLLSQIPDVFHFNATSCATYTTAGVKCILRHDNSDKLYEILPNYLYRNNVEVIWRTTNWGEPPVHIKNYQTREDLAQSPEDEKDKYDEVLLNGLKEQISASTKEKVLIILHTSTSHGPIYSKKYPLQFETFRPVCKSVELGKCSQTELINAYDNTIVYTDYLLSRVIDDLQQLKEFNSAMIFVSDHGESLGENNLYMHGMPLSLAPKEQYEIPFIVWVSDGSAKLKPNENLTQNHVFHSVLKFLNIQSPIYNEEMNIFE